VLSRILRTIREHALVQRGDRVLVAVSGGPDSTALLHGLLTLAPRLEITVCAACVDHGLRPESEDEARAVEKRCRTLGVSCAVIRVDVGQARRPHVSLQEAARTARLAALQEAAARLKCDKIALGHTADDQAETVLFRILRGTGLAGLAGIPYQRDSFVRPLLDVRRAELLRYLGKRKITFFCDPSNANRRYARPRIRHDILPMLARENPRVVEALLALSREAQGRSAKAWRVKLPASAHVSERTAETVQRLVREGRGTRHVALRDGAILVRYGQVVWQPKAVRRPDRAAKPSGERVAVPGPGEFRIFDPPAPAVEVLPPRSDVWPGGNHACFDVAQLRWPLCLRPWQPGDRMAPRSGRGTRKLSDLLIDAKIPRPDRATLPVLCDAAGTILFVPGLRPSEAGRPNHHTREWIEVRVAR
jgi:tRNA(Ile)-lysidine synthase